MEEFCSCASPSDVYVCVCVCAIYFSDKKKNEIFQRFRDVFFGRICYLHDEREDADENVIVFIVNHADAAWPHNVGDLVARVGVLARTVHLSLSLSLSLSHTHTHSSPLSLSLSLARASALSLSLCTRIVLS
jgi:hypothetical protein